MTIIFHEGFEEGQWTHDVRVFPVDAEPYTTQIGNIFTPQDWLFWFKHAPDTWDQPEARHCWRVNDPNRIKEGNGAWMFFSFWRHHDAGLMRQVTVTPGDTLRLTAWAHAWSNASLPGHEDCCDDGRCSCGVGRQVIAIALDDIPAPTGDPWSDALGNSVFVVGIDPAGGMDPYSPGVIWGDAYAIYNGYARQLEVKVRGVTGKVTVFLRNVTLYPFKHNDAYWDDVVLETFGGVEPPPPPPDGRGDPRVQYERTYVLLPPDAGQEWVHAVVTATWDKHRYTVGGSADDAGIGDLDYRRVIAVNPAGWGDGLEVFFEDYYPGIEYLPITAATPEILRQKLSGEELDIALCQCDSRWGHKDLGEDPGGETICQGGCLLTGFAICLRHAGVSILPDELNAILAEAGTPFTSDDHLTNWAAAVELFTVFDDSFKTNSYRGAATLAGMLSEGWEIVLRRADAKHFVYLEYVDGNVLHIIDPQDGERKTWVPSQALGIRAAHKTGTAPPPPPPVGNPIGLHLQSMSVGWDTYVREAEPKVTKVLASMHDVLGVKRIRPDALVVWRHVDNCYDGIIDNPDPHAGARIWIAKFRDSLYDRCHELAQIPGIMEPYFYVESINEVYPSENAEAVTRAVNFDIAFLEELDALGLPLRGVVFTAGIGNPHESEYELLVPLARKAEQYGALMGYHGYFWADHGISHLESDWIWHAGRWTEMDKVFVQHGIHVRWFGAEGGAHFDCESGWRHASCLNGDWEAYLALLLQWKAKIDEWNILHGNRYLGQVLFTTGGHGWASWEIQEPEMRSLADVL